MIMGRRGVWVAILLTYLVLSFVPSLLLTNFIGKGKRGGNPGAY
jgi:multisubunit Na+/H+ antiporter MnhF subunit